MARLAEGLCAESLVVVNVVEVEAAVAAAAAAAAIPTT